ncbi:D-Lactate dehydrogenase [Pseudoalteromonas luteoviolacea B = ATCC 29581]|nr:D-Lactate dehydrogenase [Pseudoalteromonas luteoviolacea B = ATCC 29581]
MELNELILSLTRCVGKPNIITQAKKIATFTTGFREGKGKALCVVQPTSLLQMWEILKIVTQANVAIVMQAANTGLTGGSTPTEELDRPCIVINTLKINDIHLLEAQGQFIALPGASLFELENALDPHGRVPHSVIGSSCIGASIVGGVCNNSGGALVERGPAYTELALYAKLNADGELVLINELDIDLGDSPESILTNLQTRNYSAQAVRSTGKSASDNDYKTWVRDTQSSRPARFNADKRRLNKASGCAGKLAVFAVRLDSFLKPEKKHTYYIHTDNADSLNTLRIALLNHMTELPISAEYLHRDVIHLTDHYGRDTMLVLKHFGTRVMPAFFNLKKRVDGLCHALPFVPDSLTDKASNFVARLFPSQVPECVVEAKRISAHHLILTIQGGSEKEFKDIIKPLVDSALLNVIQCDEALAKSLYSLRFAAAGAAIQYQKLHAKTTSGLLALDIALPRNCQQWFEALPDSIAKKMTQKYYYGHFICHVFHQDYLVSADYKPEQVKKELLEFMDSRGAEYPAEHNVGHLYHAKSDLAEHYKTLDPTNTFNPGIGKMSTRKDYESE